MPLSHLFCVKGCALGQGIEVSMTSENPFYKPADVFKCYLSQSFHRQNSELFHLFPASLSYNYVHNHCFILCSTFVSLGNTEIHLQGHCGSSNIHYNLLSK